MRPFIDFSWKVPEVGFEWITAKAFQDSEDQGTQGEYLVAASDRRATPARSYSAFAETGLFRRFAETETNSDCVLAFANEWGLLGSNYSFPVQRPIAGEKNSYTMVTGERLQGWGREITEMRHAIQFWEALRTSHREELEQFVIWRGPEEKHDKSHPHREVTFRGPRSKFRQFMETFVIASERDSPQLFAQFVEGDVLSPGWHALQRIVNQKLRQHGSVPQLLWHSQSRKRTSLQMHFIPQSLIGAMWLQFAHAITGNKQYRQCETCGRWFEMSAEIRQDGKFCRNACRSKAYRRRQTEARKLHAKGMSASQIAKQLNSDSKTVKGWVTE